MFSPCTCVMPSCCQAGPTLHATVCTTSKDSYLQGLLLPISKHNILSEKLDLLV